MGQFGSGPGVWFGLRRMRVRRAELLCTADHGVLRTGTMRLRLRNAIVRLLERFVVWLCVVWLFLGRLFVGNVQFVRATICAGVCGRGRLRAGLSDGSRRRGDGILRM
jgi:hypothetical protein